MTQKVVLCDYQIVPPGGAEQKPWLLRQDFLLRLMLSNGAAVSCVKVGLDPEYKADKPLEPLMLSQLDSAQAAIIPGIPGYFDFEPTSNRLISRLESGMRAWICVPTLGDVNNALSSGLRVRARRYADFLRKIGVELTNIGLFDKTAELGHLRVFALRRSLYPAGFRDPFLFRGVDKVVFQQVHAMRLHGEAQAVAAVDPNNFDVIDMASDLRFSWNEPDFALISITYIGSSGGGVIATSGLVCGDPYVGPLGHRFPGGAENSTVLTNLANFLLPQMRGAPLPAELDVHRLIQSIERNALELVMEVLGGGDVEWTASISDDVKAKAIERQRTEGAKIDWPAYLDLADHIKTVKRNSERFQAVLEQCGFPSSRTQIEEKVFKSAELIRLRILDSHMTKRVITRHAFKESDQQVLREIDQNIIKLLYAAKGLRGS